MASDEIAETAVEEAKCCIGGVGVFFDSGGSGMSIPVGISSVVCLLGTSASLHR